MATDVLQRVTIRDVLGMIDVAGNLKSVSDPGQALSATMSEAFVIMRDNGVAMTLDDAQVIGDHFIEHQYIESRYTQLVRNFVEMIFWQLQNTGEFGVPFLTAFESLDEQVQDGTISLDERSKEIEKIFLIVAERIHTATVSESMRCDLFQWLARNRDMLHAQPLPRKRMSPSEILGGLINHTRVRVDAGSRGDKPIPAPMIAEIDLKAAARTFPAAEQALSEVIKGLFLRARDQECSFTEDDVLRLAQRFVDEAIFDYRRPGDAEKWLESAKVFYWSVELVKDFGIPLGETLERMSIMALKNRIAKADMQHRLDDLVAIVQKRIKGDPRVPNELRSELEKWLAYCLRMFALVQSAIFDPEKFCNQNFAFFQTIATREMATNVGRGASREAIMHVAVEILCRRFGDVLLFYKNFIVSLLRANGRSIEEQAIQTPEALAEAMFALWADKKLLDVS